MNPIPKIVGGVVLTGTVIFAPVVPVGQMEFVAAKVQHCDAPDIIPAHNAPSDNGWVFVATSTEHKPPVCPSGTDFSVAIFQDTKGNLFYENISLERYRAMGKAKGIDLNPTKEEFTSIFDSLNTPTSAHAAVAFDSANKYTACVTGTSCTYSFTNTAGNFVTNVSTSYSTNPGTVTMSYAGASMTQTGTNQSASGAYGYMFYTTSAAATGANNLVTNTTGSLTNGFYDHANSFSGSNCTVEANTQSTTANIGNKTLSVTTTVNNDYVIGGLSSTGGRGYSGGANTTIQTSSMDSQGNIAYSSSAVNPAGSFTLNWTISASTEQSLLWGFGLEEGTCGGGGGSTPAQPRFKSSVIMMD